MRISGNASKRENQILDFVYEKGQATATELQQALPGSPSNPAVRWQLRSLEAKGLLTHKSVRGEFVYTPTKPRESVAQGELARVLSSFFGGSVVSVVTALLDQERDKLTEQDMQELHQLIEKVEKEEKK
jgi:predicted transcriptional regulator